MTPNVISHKPHITSPARSGSVRRARPRQASPAISASSASGYSQPISGPNRLPISFVQLPELPRNPPALYSTPPGAVVAGAPPAEVGAPPAEVGAPPASAGASAACGSGAARRAPPPPPKAVTEPGNEIPNRSTPL